MTELCQIPVCLGRRKQESKLFPGFIMQNRVSPNPPLRPPSPPPILFRCPKNEKEIEAKKKERKYMKERRGEGWRKRKRQGEKKGKERRKSDIEIEEERK
jgi:hypothetical protein